MKLSDPAKPAFGVYLNEPSVQTCKAGFAGHVSVPFEGPVAQTAFKIDEQPVSVGSQLSSSVSFARTPAGASTSRVTP